MFTTIGMLITMLCDVALTMRLYVVIIADCAAMLDADTVVLERVALNARDH